MERVEIVRKENVAKGRKFKLQCQSCNRETSHVVLMSVEKNGIEYVDIYDHAVDWVDSFQVIECNGCETTSFRHSYLFSEADGGVEKLYPQRSKTTLQTKQLHHVPTTLRRLYRETIDSFNIEAYTLCAAGLRVLVEGVCADRWIKEGPVPSVGGNGEVTEKRKDNLEGKIFGLVEQGILTKSSANTLHENRFLGNDAVQELALPSSKRLRLAITILEHTLEGLYEIPETATELREKRERSDRIRRERKAQRETKPGVD